MSKNKKTADFEIDGKNFKYICKKNKKTKKDEWVMFVPKENDFLMGFHFIDNKIHENHIDMYLNKRNIGKIRSSNMRPAGVLLNINDKSMYKLPPLINNDIFNNLSEIEKVKEYVKRVKLIKKD